METVTIEYMRDRDMEKLEEIAYMMSKEHGFDIPINCAASAALFEGIDKLHKAWVTDK